MIKIVCTDQGQHKRSLLARVEDGSTNPVYTSTHHGPPQSGVRFRCGCGRDVQWKDDVWGQILPAIRTAGLNEFDVSGGIALRL